MNFVRNTLHQVRFLVIAAVCALLIFSNVLPAMAAGNTVQSKPSEGETQLHGILDESEKAAQSGLDSMKEVEKRSNEGINEVQGAADANKMSNPENSQQATSIIDQVKHSLGKATAKS